MDRITWNEHASNPVLNISSDSSGFDYDGIETPSVIKDLSAPSSQRYKLWYAGRKSRCSPVNGAVSSFFRDKKELTKSDV